MSDEQPVRLSHKQSDNELYVSTTISVAVTGGLRGLLRCESTLLPPPASA